MFIIIFAVFEFEYPRVTGLVFACQSLIVDLIPYLLPSSQPL